MTPSTEKLDLADDILPGASAIALAVYGRDGEKEVRRVRHLADTQALPTFRLGRTLCARRSALMRWIEEQEVKSASGRPRPVAPPKPRRGARAGGV